MTAVLPTATSRLRPVRLASSFLVLLAVAVSAAASPVAAPPAAGSSADQKDLGACLRSIKPAEIKKLTAHLASDKMNGRYYLSEDGFRAARYIAGEFKAAGLAGLGKKGSFFQGIGNDKASPNVVAIRRGEGDRHLLLTAHYDHLEPKRSGKDRIFNGADDNAAGVAALIAIARALAGVDLDHVGSIVFIAFTGEEYGLVGSKYYVENPLLPLDKAVAILNADMISRGKPDLLFVEGGRMFPAHGAAFRRANKRAEIALDLRFDEHPRWLYMSDQKAFVMQGVPSFYLGVDFHADTHRVTDEVDRILPGLAARTARLMLAVAIDLLAGAELLDAADAARGNDAPAKRG